MPRNPTLLASLVVAFFLASSAAHGAATKLRPVSSQPDACPADVVKQTPLVMQASGATEVARGEVVSFSLLPAGNEEEGESSQAARDEATAAKNAAAMALLECLNAKAVKEGRQPKLLLNGIALGTGAKLINKTDWGRGEITFELVTALPTEATKREKETFTDFWKGIYREAGWTGADPQRVELQMEGVGTIARGDAGTIFISGSPDTRRWVAGFAALVIAGMFVWAIGSNKIFRDEAPPWIEKARTLAGLRTTFPDAASFLDEQARTFKMSVAELQLRAAEAYRKAFEDTPMKDEDEAKLAAIGVLMERGEVPEVSYSLSRVQLGAWLVVTVIGGLIIWVYQGARPVIPATYLALLGISGGTRLLSGLVDSDKNTSVGGIHKSFFTDLTAGTNGGGVHRYQAMMINIVLLTTVAFEIIGTLAFPEIDDSWLMLLTGSAGVYLAAKKNNETPPAKPTQTITTTPTS